MRKIIQIIPSPGWFHVCEEVNPPHITPVGAWGLLENGEVVGLVPKAGIHDGPRSQTPGLIEAPINAVYHHESEEAFVKVKARALAAS